MAERPASDPLDARLLPLVLSLAAAAAAFVSLADYFRASGEFSLIFYYLVAFCFIGMAVLALTQVYRPGLWSLNVSALWLVILAFLPLALPGLIQKFAAHSTNPFSVGVEKKYITIELIVPALIAVVTQWGLLRKSLRATQGPDYLPWFTFVFGCVLALNPLGLDILGAAIKQSPTDWLRDLWRMIASIAIGLLVVMALVECYIRRRKRRRGTEVLNTEN